MEELQSFDVNTGEQQVSETEASQGIELKKSKTRPIAIIMIVIIILLAGGVIFFMFYNPKGKVPRAFIKTFGDLEHQNKVIEALDISEFLADKKYTVLVDVDTSLSEVGDTSITTSLAVNKDVIELSGDVDISYIPTVEYTIQLDKNELRASCPMIPDKLFYFDYKGKNKGYVDEFLDAKFIGNQIENVYNIFVDDKDSLSIGDFITRFSDDFKDLKFENIDSAKYTVNGDKVECAGYKALLNKKLVREMFSSIMYGITASLDSVSEESNDLLDDLSYNMPAMEIEIYLYKDEIAAIKILPEEMDEYIEFRFEGGDYRLQNVAMYVNDEEIASIEGKIDGNVETATFKDSYGDILGYEYDFEEGKLEINIPEYDPITAKLIKDDRKFSFELDYIDIADTYLGLSVAITPGAKLSEMTGTEFDLGNASEEDIDELIEEIKSTVQGLLGQ